MTSLSLSFEELVALALDAPLRSSWAERSLLISPFVNKSNTWSSIVAPNSC